MAGDFLHTAGTGGVIGTVRTVTASTWLTSLASGSTATSDNIADTGVFAQSSFSNCIMGMAEFSHITNTLAATAGGCLACWWLGSSDNGSTFESPGSTTASTTVPALARSPDFIIPLYSGATATVAGNLFQTQRFWLPNVKSKLILQNFSGVAFSAHNHTLKLWGVADGYT